MLGLNAGAVFAGGPDKHFLKTEQNQTKPNSVLSIYTIYVS